MRLGAIEIYQRVDSVQQKKPNRTAGLCDLESGPTWASAKGGQASRPTSS